MKRFWKLTYLLLVFVSFCVVSFMLVLEAKSSTASPLWYRLVLLVGGVWLAVAGGCMLRDQILKKRNQKG